MNKKQEEKEEKVQKGTNSENFDNIQNLMEELKLKLPYIYETFTHIPIDLWVIFLPKSQDSFFALEVSLMQRQRIEDDREQVMRVQKRFNLPFRPNMPMRDTVIRARIELLKSRKVDLYNNPGKSGSSDPWADGGNSNNGEPF